MSEANILNPSATSLLNFDYGYSEGLPEMRALFQAQSGKAFSRRQMGRGRTYDLAWNSRDKATMHALRQWERQYENDFFTLVDWERTRYFSGRFEGPLQFSPAGNEKWNIRGRFIELPGLALNTYPSNWARDAIFLDERNGFGEDLVKLTGSGWTFLGSEGFAHDGKEYVATATSTAGSHVAEWMYLGYGFRWWALKAAGRGIQEIFLDGVSKGTVDTYSAASIAAAPLLTVANVTLGLHRVKVQNTGTKNAASTDFGIDADAIEVIQ